MNKRLIFFLSFLVPGTGHLLLKQYKRAIFGLIYTAITWFCTITALVPNIMKSFVNHISGDYAGSLVIGTTEYVDDSFMLLMGTVFSVACIIAFVAINYAFARDAKGVKIAIDCNEEVLSIRKKAQILAPEIIPNAIASPAFVLMFLFLIVPAIISILIAFTNYKNPILPPAYLLEWEGVSNFQKLFTDPRLGKAFTDTLGWTITWTICSTMLTLVLGILLAVLCNNKHIKGKKFFRTVYLLPWAVPAFLTILIFQIFFSKIGTMNTVVIPFFTGSEYSMGTAVPFLTDPNLMKIIIILIQGWLGFPYIYVLVTGILQTIPDDLYEASGIDGGNAWTNFWDITFPIVFASAAPTFITQFTFNFNNVVIIYLLTGSVVKGVGDVYGPLETIASLGYKLMTEEQDFTTAAVFTLITSTVVGAIVLWSWVRTGAFKREEVM